MTAEPPPADQPFDAQRVVNAFEQHDVRYLVVGGLAAQAFGATRATRDIDCLIDYARENLDRVGAAMRDLGARLRAEGLPDEVAKTLPVQLDAESLRRQEISTWMTDAGAVDLLADLPAGDGRHLRYADLEPRAETGQAGGVRIRCAALKDIITSKEWADRPKDHEALPELYELRENAKRQAPDTGRPPGTASPHHPTDATRTPDPPAASPQHSDHPPTNSRGEDRSR